jgi:carbamoyl-phosphate synthase large subunit
MKSTGEVMGRGQDFAEAYAKALAAVYMKMPLQGSVLISLSDPTKAEGLPIAQALEELGFILYATPGTAAFLKKYHVHCIESQKYSQGSPNCVEEIMNGRFSMIINTTLENDSVSDGFAIRRAALEKKVPYCTVLSAARTMIQAIRYQKQRRIEVHAL